VKKAVLDVNREIPLDYGPWCNFSAEGKDLVKALLTRDHNCRITASDALGHPWFRMQPWYKHVATPHPVAVVKSNIVPGPGHHAPGPDPKWLSHHEEEEVY
jgi:serine/threonine protein kinase